jgi:hypothetical protein
MQFILLTVIPERQRIHNSIVRPVLGASIVATAGIMNPSVANNSEAIDLDEAMIGSSDTRAPLE